MGLTFSLNIMKPLLPSLKEKKRYVVFEIISGTQKYPEKEIKEAFRKLFGEVGLSEAGLIFLKNKWKNKRGIIRVNHKNVDRLKASFCMVKGMTIKSVGVSGTLKKAQEKYLSKDKEVIR